jgi:selenobiotic family peptide radical SAM maturase
MLIPRWLRRRPSGFTLQWHLTQTCANHCRHCYDRSQRPELTWPECVRVLDDFETFCGQARFQGKVCLTGGDPLRFRDFWAVYEDIARRGLEVSVLGNPISDEIIEQLISVRKPRYYQVSLEGLCEHNDAVRGPGHYRATMDFLKRARRWGLTTHVMLTLGEANLDQVIPLGLQLRGLTARFDFNRLASVGEARGLKLPERNHYAAFLRSYLEERRHNPVLGFKDNLFNIIRFRNRQPLWGGCTGRGCGAALNFVALLPDGEVHACRKFPSMIGHIQRQRLSEIYASESARRYRSRAAPCAHCPLLRFCGGCPAVTFGSGQDPLQARDPHCFLS